MKAKTRVIKYLYLISFVSGFQSLALAEPLNLFLNEIPARVLVSESGNLNGKSGLITRNVPMVARRNIIVSVPEQFVIKDEAGNIKLKESLVKWGKHGQNLGDLDSPVWTSSGTYFPYINLINNEPKIYYVPLVDVVDNISNTPGSAISMLSSSGEVQILAGSRHASTVNRRKIYSGEAYSDTGKKGPSKKLSQEEWLTRYEEIRKNRINKDATSTLVEVAQENVNNSNIPYSNSEVAAQVRAIANQGSLTCNKTSNSGQCMVCNCLHEARGESNDGRVAVGRVTITRFEREGFPDSICGVVWSGSQRRSGSAFSWTIEALKSPKRFGVSDVKRCSDSTLEAIASGGWNFDHFYANKGGAAISAPSWARDFASKRPTKQIGNHLFLNSGKRVVQSFRSQNEVRTTSADTAERGIQ